MYRLERITTWNEVDQPRRIRESQTLATLEGASWRIMAVGVHCA